MAETTDGGASLPTVSLPHLTCNDNSVLPTLLVTNVRSLFQKIDELQSIAEINQVYIICITASWLTPSCPDPTISLTKFIYFRNDRLFSRGGGICVYFNAGIYCRKLEHFERPDIESLWIVLRPKRLPRSISVILLAVIYHSILPLARTRIPNYTITFKAILIPFFPTIVRSLNGKNWQDLYKADRVSISFPVTPKSN